VKLFFVLIYKLLFKLFNLIDKLLHELMLNYQVIHQFL